MNYDTILQALAVTYTLSVLVFFLWTYIGAGERVERVTYALLWPIYLCLIGAVVILGIALELLTAVLDLLWPDEDDDDPYYDQFDEDEDE